MNTELGYEAIQYVIDHPEEHDQQTWGYITPESSCGTTACLAGHIIRLSGNQEYVMATMPGTLSALPACADLRALEHEMSLRWQASNDRGTNYSALAFAALDLDWENNDGELCERIYRHVFMNFDKHEALANFKDILSEATQ